MDVWSKTGTNHRRSWIIASNGIQFSKQIPSKAYLPGKPGWKERPVSTADVVEFVEYSKLPKPSSYASEIRQALVGNGICAAANVPSRSTISDILRKAQNFTSKILSVCSEELLSGSSTKKLANLSSKY